MVSPVGQLKKGQETIEPFLLGRIRVQVEMGVGHENDRRLSLLIHAAQSE